MNPRKLWNDGAFFGLIAGSLCTLCINLIVLVPHPGPVGAAFIGLFVVLWFAWYESRVPLNAYILFRQRQGLTVQSSVPGTSPAMVPASLVVLDPYDSYLRCCQKLWRLRLRGEEDSPEADRLQEQMDVYWAQMTEDQRIKADVESGDAWKHACDDDDQIR